MIIADDELLALILRFVALDKSVGWDGVFDLIYNYSALSCRIPGNGSDLRL